MNVNLSDLELKILSKLEEGIKLEPQPYKRLALELGINEEEVIRIIKELINNNYIRRIGVSVNPTNVGNEFNALVVWSVADSKVEEIGNKLAQYIEISHCYERFKPSGWEGNLFCMVHTRDEESFNLFIANIEKELGIRPYKILKTIKELKKVKPKYVKL